MKLEKRIINSSIFAGLSEILLRVITGITFLGYLGVGLVLYGLWHKYFLWKDTK